MYQVEIQPTESATPRRCLKTTGENIQACFPRDISFCLIEQSLNTRPSVPANADASDLDFSTPHHFLPGTAGSNLLSTLSNVFDRRKRYARAQAYSKAI